MRAPVVFAVLALQLQLVRATEPTQVPRSADIKACSSNAPSSTSDYWKSFTVSCQDFLRFLAVAKVISEAKWHHEYSHVGDGDRFGHLTLVDGTRLRWMVRPGGLAWLEDQQGKKTYLVVCCTKLTSPREK